MIKLIALDIDGTLFNTQGKVTPLTKAALQSAHEKGIKLMLASGRSIHGLKQLALHNGLPLDNMILIASNGGSVSEGSSTEILFEEPINNDLAKRLIKVLKRYPVTIFIPYGDELWVDEPDGFLVALEVETENLKLKVVPDLSAVAISPNKIVLSGQRAILDQIDLEVSPQFREANLIVSGPNYLDIMAKDIDKGNALKKYCELTGIDRSEVIAFGDNYNDLKMIEFAGIGVAMDNAIEPLKSIANVITTSNDDDGIAHILRQVI